MSLQNQCIIQGEKVIIRNINAEDVEPLYILIYGEKEPEWKKWDAPYFELERKSL